MTVKYSKKINTASDQILHKNNTIAARICDSTRQKRIQLHWLVLDRLTAVAGAAAMLVGRGGWARTTFWGFGAAADKFIAWLWPVLPHRIIMG